MSDDENDPEKIRAVIGDAVMAFWRAKLDEATADSNGQLAVTGMLMVAVEALKEGMGDQSAADLLEVLAAGVRSGEDVQITIGGSHGTEH